MKSCYTHEVGSSQALPADQPCVNELALPDMLCKEGAPALPSPIQHSVPTKKKELMAHVSEVTGSTTQPYFLRGAEWLQSQASRAEQRGDLRRQALHQSAPADLPPARTKRSSGTKPFIFLHL